MISIVIGLSLHHLKVFEEFFIPRGIIAHKKILITSDKLNYDENLWDKVLIINLSPNNKSNTKLERFRNISAKIKAYSKILKSMKHYKKEEIKLFYSSLEDVLSNYLFFYFSEKTEGIIIEDGVLNYYNHDIRMVSKVNLIFKKIISIIYGINFKFYKGHTSGIDYEKSLHQYVRDPYSAVRPEKSKKMHYEKRSVNSLSNDILIIGQEPYANVDRKLYYKKLDRLTKHIIESKDYNSSSIIYYKSHRNGPRMPHSYLENKFLDKKIVFLNTDDNIENLYFDVLKTKVIFTFDSSAVLNIYLGSNDETRGELIINVMPFYNSNLVRLFSRMRFNILKDDF